MVAVEETITIAYASVANVEDYVGKVMVDVVYLHLLIVLLGFVAYVAMCIGLRMVGHVTDQMVAPCILWVVLLVR
tara:strand:+ start:437 stop:661 length:225 start_codon:yes stop_codon:yes gene_type:complete